jgi:hypothetical protein
MPINLRRLANILDTAATLFQEFCDRFSKYGDKTLTLFADGQARCRCFFDSGPAGSAFISPESFFNSSGPNSRGADLYCVPRPSLLLDFFRCRHDPRFEGW